VTRRAALARHEAPGIALPAAVVTWPWPPGRLRFRADLIAGPDQVARPAVVLVSAEVITRLAHRPCGRRPAWLPQHRRWRCLRRRAVAPRPAGLALIRAPARIAGIAGGRLPAARPVGAGQAERTGIPVSRGQRIGPDRAELLEPVLGRDVGAIVR
jgi:hypothetical protein